MTEFLREFWEVMAFSANSLIFLLTGLIIGSKRIVLGEGELFDYCCLALVYCLLHVSRLTVFLLLRPVMDRLGYGVSFQDCAISVWGGLRGALGLALALVVYGDRCGARTTDCIDPQIADRFLFHTAGIVVLTLCVNSMTIQSLVETLGMDKVPVSKEHIFGIAMQKLKASGCDEVRVLKQDPLYGCASWPDVRRFQFKPPKIKVAFYSTQDSENQIERGEMQEARRRFLVTVKASYWRQFKEGLLGRHAARELIELTDQALDHGCDMENDWDIIFSRAMRWGSRPIISLKRLLSLPIMNKLARRVLFHSLSHSYDTISSYLAAREEAIKLLARFLASEDIFQDIKERATSDISRAKTCLFHIQSQFPEISASIATNHAARTVLNTQRHAVQELREEGMLDEAEAARMTRAIEAQMKRLQAAPPAVELPDKERLLAEMLWLESLPQNVVRRVHDNAHETLFQQGEVIIRQGDIGEEMYLIARGTVAVEMNEAANTAARGRRRSIWGGSSGYAKVGDTIRNIRRRTSIFTRSTTKQRTDKSRNVKVDDLGVGSVIGELACLTQKHRFATVRITSPSIMFCIKSEQLLNIVADSPAFGHRLWSVAGRRLTENLLVNSPPYSSWSRHKIRRWVEGWELHSATDTCVFQTDIFVLLSGSCSVLPPSAERATNGPAQCGSYNCAPMLVTSAVLTDGSLRVFFPHKAHILVPKHCA